jgi:catalase
VTFSSPGAIAGLAAHPFEAVAVDAAGSEPLGVVVPVLPSSLPLVHEARTRAATAMTTIVHRARMTESWHNPSRTILGTRRSRVRSLLCMSELGERLIDAVTAIAGTHAGYRAVHALGTCATGTFTATAAAASLSRAAQFSGAPVPATVRFSNGNGDPARTDGEPDGRGIAVKLRPGEHESTDLVGLSLPVFFVRTVDDFLAFCAARVPDPATGGPDPERLGGFIGEHPECLGAVQATLEARPPASYVSIPYFGIHAFRFVNAAGESRFVRYRWEPDAQVATLTDDEVAAAAPRYLVDELQTRLAAGPASFTLVLQLADETDDPNDPTTAWPDDRETVVAGSLELDTFTGDGCDALIFDPTRVLDGVECSDDPILHARSEAYGVSYSRRTTA